MKKTFSVQITKIVEVEVPDKVLTDDQIKEFSSFMFPVSGEEDILQYVAQSVAVYEDGYVEGVGNVGFKILSEEIDVS